MGKINNNKELKPNEKKKIKMMNNAFRSINYILILVLFNLSGDGIIYGINEFCGLDGTHISYKVLRCLVKIVIPLVLAVLLEIFQERIRKGFNKFIWNLSLFVTLIIIISFIYNMTN